MTRVLRNYLKIVTEGPGRKKGLNSEVFYIKLKVGKDDYCAFINQEFPAACRAPATLSRMCIASGKPMGCMWRPRTGKGGGEI